MKSNKEKILILLPSNYQLYTLIEKNLLENGYDATVLIPDLKKFKYRNFYQKIKNFQQKTFLNNREYKRKLKEEFVTHQVIEAINKHSFYDYVLVIRADFFSLEILEHAKSKTHNFVSYHFDGINRYPEIFKRIRIFDRFYVFDRQDIEQYSNFELLPCTNFYFDFYELRDENIKFDFYFLGSYHESRNVTLLNFQKFAEKHQLVAKMDIVYDKENKPKSDFQAKFECMTNYISFEKYLLNVQNSRYILDILISEHRGLSFRVFESLKYKKKLITSNPTIVDYEFYHPNNIFVLDNNYDQLLEFLDLPYVDIDASIVNTYSFTNWLNYLLRKEPYRNIDLPDVS